MPDELNRPEKTKPLAYEDFLKRRNNFSCHFAGKPGEHHHIGDIYRNRQPFQTCLANNPAFAMLAVDLYGYDFSEFEVAPDSGSITPRVVDPEMLRKLYQAYLMMRPFAKDDGELFG